MISHTSQLTRGLYFTSLFALLPLWNIPHTIAARYFFAILLLVVVAFSNPGWKAFFRHNKILLVFFAYLFVHLIFFSIDFESALENFTAEWMKLILFSVLGAGAGLTVARYRPGKLMFLLGLAFCIPLLIHLGVSFYEGLQRRAIPWGYWGINEIHGDLGYTAIHATIFLSVYFLYQARRSHEKALSLCLLSACIASPLLASSRGGTAFVLIALVFVSLAALAARFKDRLTLKRQLAGVIAVLLIVLTVLEIGSLVDPGRWNGVMARMGMGLKGDPIRVTCDGIGVLQKQLESEGQVITPEISSVLRSISGGDGARTMTARAALILAADNPMGIDQSKKAYQIAISRDCDPAIFMAHAHNGWLDTALAIGIPGAVLYLLVLLNFANLGLKSLKQNDVMRPYAIALLVMSTIWIVRALLDSTQRDQMLEMQVFTICFLYGVLVNHKNSDAVVVK